MRRIKLCQLITELRPAGAERCVYELATRLDRGRFDVNVVALRGGAVADRLADAGVDVTVLDVRGKWDVFKLGGLTRLLKDRRIDILHTHLFHADLAGRSAARFAGVPNVVHTVHIAEQRFLPWRFAYARLFDKWCDRIVCVSQAVMDHHARHTRLPLERYRLIPNGIDVDAYRRDDAARRSLRDEWGIGDDETAVAFLGRLDPQKGLDVLLAVVGMLHARGTKVRWLIAGDGPQRPMLERFLATEAGGGVRYLGFVDDVRGLLSAADVLAMPSRWEGLPLAATEAMAAGLPVAATNVAGLSEVVDDGRTGLLVPSGDAAAMAEAIASLAADSELRRKLGAAGAEKARREYSIDRYIAAHEQMYLSLTKQTSEKSPQRRRK